jgi:hypothetical protein
MGSTLMTPAQVRELIKVEKRAPLA